MWSAWLCVKSMASTRVDAVRQRLLAQVGRRVDEDRACVGHVDVDRRPQPLVARIGRAAHGAGAADHRHAVRRAGAEKR